MRRIKFLKPEEIPVTTPADIKVPLKISTPLLGDNIEMMVSAQERTAVAKINMDRWDKYNGRK